MKFSIEKLPTDLLLELAEKHKSLRKHAGYSQRELAERSGVSLASIKRFEQTGLISLESLLQLAAVLDRLKDFETVFNPTEDFSRIEQLFTKTPRK
ncbi:MAG: transcriptional regulator [Candidatus Fluviicola riflensis]|nr:MAG: transcriptional regulator [Candidatus Fluviicola riflensis]OGS79722.1 MAG: transcriptional regulator [Candidatus Fluviicola riflensis]OGS87155.1 MAG: transcriptional regulator [Fluviicola sp. RIFCSPHIGHO2_01_FULL_43_53]OGS89943.1 MAG: transcriptional regulator [Fluviicola sp. RIFCSPHIGHO2_12_FULL_43_24]